MTRILVFDLETIPDLVMGARVWRLDPERPDAYEEMARVRLEETEQKTEFGKPFAHRIVGLGMVLLDTDLGRVAVLADAGENEAEMIRQFHGWLKDGPVLVTWNGLGFDLPVLRYRAIYHGLALPRLYGKEGQKSWDKYDYRFGDMHYDLCDVLSGFGRSPSLKLSEFAALCGLRSKTVATGEDVLPLWKAGRHDVIREYVGDDARVTARGFLRWQMSRGRLDPKMMLRLDEQLERNDAGVVPAPEPTLALQEVP